MKPSRVLRRPGFLVYLCGLGTSALVLWLVDLLNARDVNIMGWYANGIIPAGALLVGMGSGVGYALGARFLNVKLSRPFLLGMITTGLLDYVAAQGVTYANLIESHHISADRYSFFAYLQDICENMRFTRSGSGEAGAPLGWIGYIYKALEMAGFSFGTMVPCAILYGMPYCHGCQAYLKNHAAGRIHSPVLTMDVKRLPRRERPAAVQQASDEVVARANALLAAWKLLPLEQTVAELAQVTEAPVKKSTAWIHFQIRKCPHCDSHHLATALNFVAANGKPGTTNLPAVDKPQGG